MFVGHYSAGFALKAARPDVPLWVLFIAVQLVDFGWGLLVFLGVEKARYIPGFTEAFPLDLYFMPYTHGLLACVVWSVVAGALWFAWKRGQGAFAAASVAAAVFSHWVADFIMHPGDLPLVDESHKVGLGLWKNALGATVMEVGLLVGSVALFSRAFPQHASRAWKLCAVMSVIQVANTYGPSPPSVYAIAAAAFVAYLAFARAARWVES